VIGGGTAGRAMAERFATVSATVDGSVHPFIDPWGAYVVPMFALVARRHMHQFGTTERQIAAVSATIRNHGHINPAAIMYGRGPYSVDDVLASRPIASPLRLLDCCLVGQGGAAVVITTMERARDLRQPPVALLGAGMEVSGGSYVDPPAYRDVGQLGAAAARRVYAMAGVGPQDVDVFNLYDPTSFEIIRQFEVLGLCAEGEGGAFVEDGRIAMGGTHPTNLDGGLLSYAWNSVQQMTLKLVESVLQLRGAAGYRQVPGAEVAVATNSGSGAAHWEMAVLGRA
jgi:acetyl-CoA acetyltransferase